MLWKYLLPLTFLLASGPAYAGAGGWLVSPGFWIVLIIVIAIVVYYMRSRGRR